MLKRVPLSQPSQTSFFPPPLPRYTSTSQGKTLQHKNWTPFQENIEHETALDFLFNNGDMPRPPARNRMEALMDWLSDNMLSRLQKARPLENTQQG